MLCRASRCRAPHEETNSGVERTAQKALLVVNVLLSKKQTVREHRLRTQNWSGAEKHEVVDDLQSGSEGVVSALGGFPDGRDWFKVIMFYYLRKMT